MSIIIQIAIKGCSGYGPVDTAYDDKLTLTPTGIRYEYKPYLESDFNSTRKWSYKTNSPLFKVGFERVSEMMPSILEAEETFLCTDVGMIDFTVTYEDKSKKHIITDARTHPGVNPTNAVYNNARSIEITEDALLFTLSKHKNL